MTSCLLILNIQNDTVDDKIINSVPKINSVKNMFKHIIYVVKEYPRTHSSFKGFGGERTATCVVNSNGAQLYSGLVVDVNYDIQIKLSMLNLYDSDSAFWISRTKESDLIKTLRQHSINKIFIVGVNVFTTALDCIRFRLDTTILTDLCSNSKESDKDTNRFEFLEKNCVTITTSEKLNL